ncbi:LysR substrate-binding domain-containing protein [Pseudoalteromonas obscura]|uniref:LysR substrate-binding domain-containing protein n=1 Tax=Pseudoalteromonas obscura TaxID=3048491 RepID=A0ABT7EJZ6_9GAMM|nr:LysR substrate-binding domain-containing protein [Pseudoalteromonas sp. P94(2023)]MDK2595343.1 LysR substrate-binding domain-containing protein [Pseudoalteromonas sp. P94(2023)]
MFKNINLLVTFECAARHNSYSLAAKELYISQAAVSQQMRQLESTLGTRLFIRKGKQMQLSQSGQSLFEYAQKGLTILNQGVSQLQNEEVDGELTITSTQAFIALWLMPRLQSFTEQYPNIQITISSSASFVDLKQNHLDLAIRFGQSVEQNTPNNLVCDYFGESAVYPICSNQFAQQLNLNSPENLLSQHIVTLENPGPYDWPTWFKAAGVSGVECHTLWTKVNSTDMAISAVASGHGVTLAVPYLCQQQLDNGTLVIPYKLAHPNTVKRYFVYDSNSPRLARLKVFTDWVKNEITKG